MIIDMVSLQFDIQNWLICQTLILDGPANDNSSLACLAGAQFINH